MKPVENRTWNTKVRGEVLIHASKSYDKAGYEWVRVNFPRIDLPLPSQFERGGIVGSADLYAVATASSSPWFSGPFGFCLRDAKPLPFVPMLGRLGFFDTPNFSPELVGETTNSLEVLNQTLETGRPLELK